MRKLVIFVLLVMVGAVAFNGCRSSRIGDSGINPKNPPPIIDDGCEDGT